MWPRFILFSTACFMFQLRAMLASGRATNSGDNRGWKPIHYAADLGNKTSFDLLVNAGANQLSDLGGGLVVVSRVGSWPWGHGFKFGNLQTFVKSAFTFFFGSLFISGSLLRYPGAVVVVVKWLVEMGRDQEIGCCKIWSLPSKLFLKRTCHTKICLMHTFLKF